MTIPATSDDGGEKKRPTVEQVAEGRVLAFQGALLLERLGRMQHADAVRVLIDATTAFPPPEPPAVLDDTRKLLEYIWDRRGVTVPCVACSGLGVRTYGNTAAVAGGVGGSMITQGRCNKCGGSGDTDRPWALSRPDREDDSQLPGYRHELGEAFRSGVRSGRADTREGVDVEHADCPCGAALIQDGAVVKSHWQGRVCEDCEAMMFRRLRRRGRPDRDGELERVYHLACDLLNQEPEVLPEPYRTHLREAIRRAAPSHGDTDG